MRLFDPIRWFLKDEEVASRLMQLTVLLAQLKSGSDVRDAFFETLGPIRKNLPLPLLSVFAAKNILPERIFDAFLASSLRFGLGHFSKKFIAGNGIDEIISSVQRHIDRGYFFNVDILGEASLSEKEAESYVDGYCELMTALTSKIVSPDLSASVKLSACYSQIDPFSPEHSVKVISSRLRRILYEAERLNWHVYFDVEERDLREIHFSVFKILFSEYGERARFVLQSYFHDSDKMIERLCDLKARVNRPLWVRQVLGAYWDQEQYLAQLRGWQNLVITSKPLSDLAFSGIYKLGWAGGLTMVPGTMNAARILECRNRRAPPEFQMLFGMGELIQKELLRSGERVRLYMPVSFPEGNIVQFLGYLLRRILENTSQMNFLCQNSGSKMKKSAKELRKGLNKANIKGGAF